jgi:hypothetical protein
LIQQRELGAAEAMIAVIDQRGRRCLESNQPKALSLFRSMNFNQVHENNQKPNPASSRQNIAIEGTS